MEVDSLQHHGVKGMKWGIRRYQNKDGSLTPAGKKRAAKLKDEYASLTGKQVTRSKASVDSKGSSVKKSEEEEKSATPKRKSVKEMSDAELQATVTRLNLEQRYSQLNPKQVSAGKKFADHVFKQVIVPVATDVAKNALRDYATNALKKTATSKK